MAGNIGNHHFFDDLGLFERLDNRLRGTRGERKRHCSQGNKTKTNERHKRLSARNGDSKSYYRL
jgi:hypothetical protein